MTDFFKPVAHHTKHKSYQTWYVYLFIFFHIRFRASDCKSLVLHTKYTYIQFHIYTACGMLQGLALQPILFSMHMVVFINIINNYNVSVIAEIVWTFGFNFFSLFVQVDFKSSSIPPKTCSWSNFDFNHIPVVMSLTAPDSNWQTDRQTDRQ